MSFCPNENCENYGRVPSEWPNDLYKRGMMESKGTQRFECRACGRTFSSIKPIDYERNIKIAILRMLTGGNKLEDISSRLNVPPTNLKRHLEDINKKLQGFEANELLNSQVSNAPEFGDLDGNFPVSFCLETEYLLEIYQQKDDSEIIPLLGNLKPQSIAYLRNKVLPRVTEVPNDQIDDVLNILRIWFNFKVLGEDGQTPAMRADITKSPTDLTMII